MANKQRRGVVTGQRVTSRKIAFSRELRSQMTPAETLLWGRLRGGGLGGLKFRRQQIISGYIADFYCDSVGLVVEVDGPIHARQREYDERRDAAMRERGLRVLRVSNAAVLNEVGALLTQIDQLCRAT